MGRIFERLRKVCGGSNLSTISALWGLYNKKCISLVRICLQTRKARNASTKFRKTLESKKTEKSLEISVFLLFSCLHLNQTLIMAGMAGFEPTNAGVKVPCLTAWRHPNMMCGDTCIFYHSFSRLSSVPAKISCVRRQFPNAGSAPSAGAARERLLLRPRRPKCPCISQGLFSWLLNVEKAKFS